MLFSPRLDYMLILVTVTLTFDPGYCEAIATETRAAGPSAVAPCSRSLGTKERER